MAGRLLAGFDFLRLLGNQERFRVSCYMLLPLLLGVLVQVLLLPLLFFQQDKGKDADMSSMLGYPVKLNGQINQTIPI